MYCDFSNFGSTTFQIMFAFESKAVEERTYTSPCYNFSICIMAIRRFFIKFHYLIESTTNFRDNNWLDSWGKEDILVKIKSTRTLTVIGM